MQIDATTGLLSFDPAINANLGLYALQLRVEVVGSKRYVVQRHVTLFRVAPCTPCNAMSRYFVLRLSAYTRLTILWHGTQQLLVG
jgi:hypothetical protein